MRYPRASEAIYDKHYFGTFFSYSLHWWLNISPAFFTRDLTIEIFRMDWPGFTGAKKQKLRAGNRELDLKALQFKPREQVHGTTAHTSIVHRHKPTADTARTLAWDLGGSTGLLPTNMDLRGWERICTKDGKSLKGGGCICPMRHSRYLPIPSSRRTVPIQSYRKPKPGGNLVCSYDDRC